MASHNSIAVPSKNVFLRPWLWGLLLATALPVTAGSPLTMGVSPAISTAPSSVRIQVRIEPDAKNRALEIVADSGDFYRSSLIPLEGKDAPRTFILEYPALPSGDYVISGTLSDDRGKVRGFVSRNVILVGPGYDR